MYKLYTNISYIENAPSFERCKLAGRGKRFSRKIWKCKVRKSIIIILRGRDIFLREIHYVRKF